MRPPDQKTFRWYHHLGYRRSHIVGHFRGQHRRWRVDLALLCFVLTPLEAAEDGSGAQVLRGVATKGAVVSVGVSMLGTAVAPRKQSSHDPRQRSETNTDCVRGQK